MTFAQSVRTCLSKYATFQGRASRSEYWWFLLFVLLTLGALFLLGAFVARLVAPAANGADLGQSLLLRSPLATAIFGAAGLFYLAMLMPMWAVGVRRFHDRDFSGWAYLGFLVAGAIPLVGWIISLAGLVISILPSKPGANRYGLDPRQPVADIF
jgi:uncharacterized membrane protein YhaH (DUF805 family)